MDLSDDTTYTYNNCTLILRKSRYSSPEHREVLLTCPDSREVFYVKGVFTIDELLRKYWNNQFRSRLNPELVEIAQYYMSQHYPEELV